MMFRRFALALLALGGLCLAAFALTAFWSPWDEVRKVSSTTVEISEPGVFSAVRDRVPRLTVRLVRNGIAYAIDDHFLYVSTDSGRTFERRGAIPKVDPDLLERIRNRVARHPLVRRIRENRGPSSVAVLDSGTVLLFYDRIYRSTDGGWSFQALPRIDDRVHPPFPHGVAVDDDDRVYFGDYRADDRPHEVRVYRGTADGAEWEVCHAFPSGEVFHVHSVDWDPYEGRLLVSTGDDDQESWLLELDPECDGVTPIGGGNQRWRMIAPLFTADALVWGNDDNREGSAIFELPRGGSTPIPRKEIGTPSYHASLLSGGTMVVATTFEERSVWARSANPDPVAELWGSRTGTRWSRLDSFDWDGRYVDGRPTRALLRLPVSDGSLPVLFASPVATSAPFATFRYRIRWEEALK